MQQSISFPSGAVNYIFRSPFEEMWKTYDKQHAVIITNEYIARLYASHFKGLKMLIVPPVERSKDLETIASLAKQLLQMEAGRNTLLVGVGGTASWIRSTCTGDAVIRVIVIIFMYHPN